MSKLSEQLIKVLNEVNETAAAAGREPDTVKLLAVSKTFPASDVLEAYQAGQKEFGENRVQELVQFFSELRDILYRMNILRYGNPAEYSLLIVKPRKSVRCTSPKVHITVKVDAVYDIALDRKIVIRIMLIYYIIIPIITVDSIIGSKPHTPVFILAEIFPAAARPAGQKTEISGAGKAWILRYFASRFSALCRRFTASSTQNPEKFSASEWCMVSNSTSGRETASRLTNSCPTAGMINSQHAAQE